VSAKGIYSALSGAMAQSQRLETIANNLANANTTGFKKDTQTFSEYVTANEKFPDSITVPRITASVESFYDLQGGDRAYADSSGTFSDFSQGALKNTEGRLDFAIEGKGFFEVLTPDGVKLTRAGSFKTDNQGRLVNGDGHLVLRGGAGGDPAQRVIQLSGKNVTVGYGGEVFDGENSVGKLSVVDVENRDALQKVGNSLYTLKPNLATVTKPADDFKIHQGFLEMSNVNVVDEMTNMIQASRTFEANRNSIKAFDQMDEKLMNVVPKTT
jgi:flagellar basal-body rod protein FlgG